jgi:type I protein arginine methyltransferase
MGFFLLYEGMLDSVIYARDKFLKKDGLMFPERAKIYIAAADDLEYKIKDDSLWTENEYGINMTCMRDKWEEFMIVEKIMPN